MYLSYSGYKTAIDCLFAYWNSYINKTPKTIPDDRLGSIYGSVTGKLFEDFYALKVWREPNPQAFLMSRVVATVEEVIHNETTFKMNRPGGILMWKGDGPGQNPKGMYANKEELIADVKDTVPRGLQIIRDHRLVGPRTDAEYKLDFHIPGGHILGGRADFVIERVKPHNDLIIVDGKGSKHRDKYVDPTQLKWYAMLFYLHSVKDGKPRLPDNLAFLFWKFPPDKAIDWVGVSVDDVNELMETVLGLINKIQQAEKLVSLGSSPNHARGVFKPKASEHNCRFCPYSGVCPPGLKVQEDLCRH